MKLVTYMRNDITRIGFVMKENIIDLNDAYSFVGERDFFVNDMISLISKGQKTLERIRNLQNKVNQIGEEIDKISIPITKSKLMAPVLNPKKIICIGLNYIDHAKEAGRQLPKSPVIFGKFSNSLIGSEQSICIPPIAKTVDYEAELGVVIGKKGYRIEESEALKYVAGYTNFNDISDRTLQRIDVQWMKGKILDTFAPMGPWLVTADEIEDPGVLDINLRLNGKIMQASNTKNMIFSVSFLVSYISKLLTLEPGDVIATGTPSGCGFSQKPPVFLKPGDIVEMEIEGLGILKNSLKEI